MSSLNSSSAALLSAVKKVDYAKVQKLLSEHGLPIDDKWNDYKILIHAVHTGNIKIVKLLLSYGCRVKSSKSNSCKTPLCCAVHDKNLEMVKILLEAGASINDKDSNVDTPLYMAMKNKFLTAVDLMLSKYNVESIDVTNADEIVHFYIACARNNVDLVKSFIRHGIDVNTCVSFEAELWPGYSPLHFAVEYQCVEVVELLLSYGADYTFLDANKMSPLHVAYCLENSEKRNQIMDYITFLHNTNATNPVGTMGITHFHIACSHRNPEAVKNFLKSGVAVNFPTADNYYPLHLATGHNRVEIVEILLRHGASVNVKFDNLTPLHIAIKKKFTRIAKLLLTYGANVCAKDEDDCTPIHRAYYALNGSYETVHSVMAVHQGKMINVIDKYGLSIFHIACAAGDINAVENFIQRKVDINASLGENFEKLSGFTGLHFAAMNYHEDVIKVLLKNKVDVNAVDKEGRSAIWLAVELVIKKPLICKLNENLLKNKSSYDEAGVTEEEVMNFMYKEVRKIPIVKLLAENWSNLNRPNEKGIPLLVKALAPDILWEVTDNIPNQDFIQSISKKYNSVCRKKILRILIKNGIGLYARDENQDSLLHMLAIYYDESNENLEIARMLLTSGCNPNFKNKENSTALHFVAWKGSVEYAKLLLEYKANPNCANELIGTPLHYAAAKSSTDDPGVESPEAKIVRLLIANGADVNAKNTHGRTPLFAAVRHRRTMKQLLYLLKANCQVNVCSIDGRSPLLVAAREKNHLAVKLLLDYGADINLNCKKECGLLRSVCSSFIVVDFQDYSFMETFKVLEMYLEKLRLINYPISRDDLEYRKHIGVILASGGSRNVMEVLETAASLLNKDSILLEKDNYITPMLQAELEKMKNIKIDGYTSLYNILFKTDIQMVKHVKNEIFNEYLEEDTLHVEFQHYGFLLRLKYKQGMERYVLLEPAKESFRQLIGLDLPDLCLNAIFVGLSNADLERLTYVYV